ncbi:MAG: hypothetical protein LLF94_05100 [Chlamydiales bacterium]|nr:hypothetical protein [Chlamydiales bacterium]
MNKIMKAVTFGVLSLLTIAQGLQQPLIAAKPDVRNVHQQNINKPLSKRLVSPAKKINAKANQNDPEGPSGGLAEYKMPPYFLDGKLRSADAAFAKKASSTVQAGESTGCCSCIPISQADFDVGSTYIIDTPGKYCLAEDIFYTALPSDPITFEVSVAIIIAASNVVLDLCGHTISQTNNVLGFEGVPCIVLNPFTPLQNITIQNGTITQFSGNGVLAITDSSAVVSDVHLFDLNILGCGLANDIGFSNTPGIALIGLDPLVDIPTYKNAAFRNIVIERCRVNESIGGYFGALSIFIIDFNNVVIRDTQVNNTITPFQDGNVVGGTFGYYLAGNDLQMYNCQGNNTRAEDTSGSAFNAQVGGLICQRSRNVYVKDCQFNNTFAESSNIVNNNLSVTLNAVYENCQFNNTQGGADTEIVAGVHCSGFRTLQEDGKGYKFINCQFNGARIGTETRSVLPFLLGGCLTANISNITFENCEARDITTDSGFTEVFGVFIASTAGDIPSFIGNGNNVVFRNCVVSDLSGNYSTIGIRTGGLNIMFTGEQVVHYNTVVENCIAERISCTIPQDDFRDFPLAVGAAGIADFNELFPSSFRASSLEAPLKYNYYVKGCRVSDVHSSIVETGLPASKSAGIIADSVERPIIIENDISDCDRGILLTGFGGILPGPAGSSNPSETCFQVAQSRADATAVPPDFIELTANPLDVPGQSFTNVSRDDTVILTGSSLLNDRSFLCTDADLSALGWQQGDKIIYHDNGQPEISPLVDGGRYYAIVYRPGFSENGLIKNNNVTNCLISGFQDKKKCTSSVWLDNTAYCNGKEGKWNYAIHWGGKAPVTEGTLRSYPKVSEFADANISITCAQCSSHKKHGQSKSKSKHKRHKTHHSK